MIECSLQLKNNVLYPFSEEDQEKLRGYKENQILKAKVSGVKKPRSYRQLKGYWAACKTTAENNEPPGWQTKEQVDFQCRVALNFYDPDLIIAKPNGTIVFHYRSIAFKNLGHIEANDYFSKSFELMSRKIGVSVKELLKNSEG